MIGFKKKGFKHGTKIKGKDPFKVVGYKGRYRETGYYRSLEVAKAHALRVYKDFPDVTVTIFRNSNGKFKKLKTYKRK